jgi:hypothetical protein
MVPSKKRTIALFLGAYVCLVMGEALCFIICTMQPNYRASLLNSNSNCLTGFLIVVTWQTLIIALLSWTPGTGGCRSAS